MVMGDTRRERPRVREEEVVHPVLVTGEDHDEVLSRSASITWSRISIASAP